jgi:hypothetical protein
MEEDVNKPEDEGEEFEEIEMDTNNPIIVFCFMFMEYVKEIDPDMYKKAHKYAQDHTDLDITDFEIDFDELVEDKNVDEDDIEEDLDFDDDNYEANN